MTTTTTKEKFTTNVESVKKLIEHFKGKGYSVSGSEYGCRITHEGKFVLSASYEGTIATVIAVTGVLKSKSPKV